MMRRLARATLAILITFGWSAGVRGGDDAAPLDFIRDVRPILSDRCFTCHGPDEAERKAGLRLDTPTGAFAETESGARAIVPGDLEESELLWRITSEFETEVMPPPELGKPLTEEEVATLRRWVEQGADYEVHWAFTPPRRPEVPAVETPDWCRNPIDPFVLSHLEREGLAPSAEADRIALIRRLSLDLTGLPPEPEEVDAFLADEDSDAYERLVDRLLGSPHHGERWGRFWLDAARYADSDGFEKDKGRQVWFYRDWVVNALNRDLPYDQFIIEQLAGDLLPDATQDQVVATGFLRNSMINEEGGADPEEFRMAAMFDRMEALGKGVLGLTIQCAQCHTHKYDPLTQEEYYGMLAFLNNSHEANVAVYTPREQMQRAEVLREIGEIEAELKHRNPDWPERMASWEATVRGDQPEWTVIRPEAEANSTGGSKYLPMNDGSFLASGYAPTKHRVDFEVTIPPEIQGEGITAFRLELMNDPNLPLGGPGRSIKGTGALTEFAVAAAPASNPVEQEAVKIVSATASVNPAEAELDPIYHDKSDKTRLTGPIDFAIDGKDATAWGHDIGPVRRNRPAQAVFHVETPIAHEGGIVLHIYLKQNHGGWNSDDNQNHNLGRFRLSVTTTLEAVADPLPPEVRAIVEAPPGSPRTAGQTDAVFAHWRTTVPEWTDVNARIEDLWSSHPEGTTQLVLQEREDPRATMLLARGEYTQPEHEVGVQVPAFLNPLPPGDGSPDRLAFARWLVDRDSPTTARAVVNRIWQTYFGTGLVETSEDLGSQASAPSHPELLDWLAVEFMDSGWSQKHLHRLIVTSATYRQASKVTPELLARDPYNRLLARGPRFRMEAEAVRDITLAASGLLNRELGGPSVHPPAPEFLFQPPASYGPKPWPEHKGPDRYRRALYTFRYRSVPYPALETFDAPNGDTSCVRRTRSNTPLQALAMLNEPLVLESARALARLTLNDGGKCNSDRLAFAFRRCTSREPTDRETSVLSELLNAQRARFESGDLDPWSLAADDPENPPELPADISPAELAAWTAVARVLLNLDETITKE